MKLHKIKQFVDEVTKDDVGIHILLGYIAENIRKESNQFLISRTEVGEKESFRIGLYCINTKYSDEIEKKITQTVQEAKK